MLNLFFSGILAGLEVAAHYSFRRPAALLDAKPQIQLRQALVRRLRWLVPLFFLPALITGVLLSFSGTGSLVPRLIALTALAVWIYIRIIGTVRINAASLDWNPDNPPADWREQIEKAEQFHVTGTWLTVIAFAGFLLS